MDIKTLLILWIDIFLVFSSIIIVHELSHVLGFKIMKVPILALYLGPICIYHKRIWKIKLLKSFRSIFSGMTLFEIPYLKNQNEWKLFKKKYLFALILGPFVTSLNLFVVIVIYVINRQFIRANYEINLFFLLFFIISSYMLISFFMKRKSQLGDFYVYKTLVIVS